MTTVDLAIIVLVVLCAATVAAAAFVVSRTRLKAQLARASANETIERLTAEHRGASERLVALAEANLRLERALATATAERDAARNALEDEQPRIELLKGQLAEIFDAKAQAALEHRQSQFAATTEQKQKELDGLLMPFKEQLVALQANVTDLEAKRNAATAELKTTIEALMSKTETLSTATTILSTSFTGSASARGKWGELHLDNMLERAGMSAYCDRESQAVFSDIEGGARPDVLVRIPHANLRVPVDAKAPDVEYRAYVNAPDEARRREALSGHVRAIESHVKALADRNYGRFEGIAPFTIMYVPNEAMLAIALVDDPELWDRAARRNVYLASPLTLILQLRAYAQGWAAYEQEQNAREIAKHGSDLYHRIATFAGHFLRIGNGLNSATNAYNNAVSSYERRVIPQLRRMNELGIEVAEADKQAVEERVVALEALAQQPAYLHAANDDGTFEDGAVLQLVNETRDASGDAA